jgi:hypothetical protein
MKNVLICLTLATLLVGCESLPSSVFQSTTTFNNKDVESCEGSFQCRIIELPSLPGCATPSGYKAFSSKELSDQEVSAYEQSVAKTVAKKQNNDGCPMVYPAQALCVNKRCEAITLGK